MESGPRRSRRATVILIALAFGCVVVVGGITAWALRRDGSRSPESKVSGTIGVGSTGLNEAAPVFTLPALSNNAPTSLSTYQGKRIVLNFWRSDCTPCRDEFKELKAAYASRDANTIVLGIATDSIPQDARDFVRHQHATWPQVLDVDLEVSKAYGIAELPQTFFVRPDGTVAFHVFGRLNHSLLAQGLRSAS